MPVDDSQMKINNYIAYKVDNRLGVMLNEVTDTVSRLNNRAYYTEGEPGDEDFREYYVIRKDELDDLVEEIKGYNTAISEELQSLRVLVTDYRISV